MTCQTEDQAVHCPHCQAEPGTPCRTPSGKVQKIVHGARLGLIYEIAHPGSGRYQKEAALYVNEYPDVEVKAIICAPSRAQVLWWKRWGRSMRYNQALYEMEHGPDTSLEDVPQAHTHDDEPLMTLDALSDMLKLPAKARRKPKP